MVEYTSARLDRAFSALSDPTRRAILVRLSEGDLSIRELAEPFDVSLTAVSKHVKVLRRARLLTTVKRGRVRFCRLSPGPLGAAVGWITRRFWEGRLRALADHMGSRRKGP